MNSYEVQAERKAQAFEARKVEAAKFGFEARGDTRTFANGPVVVVQTMNYSTGTKRWVVRFAGKHVAFKKFTTALERAAAVAALNLREG